MLHDVITYYKNVSKGTGGRNRKNLQKLVLSVFGDAVSRVLTAVLTTRRFLAMCMLLACAASVPYFCDRFL